MQCLGTSAYLIQGTGLSDGGYPRAARGICTTATAGFPLTALVEMTAQPITIVVTKEWLSAFIGENIHNSSSITT